jgi:signal peptidase II
MPISHKFRLAVLLLALVCTIGCDQTSKRMARRELGGLGSITLSGGFGELRLAENPGSFLSLGDSLPERLRLPLFTIVIGVGLIGLLVYLAAGCRFSWLSFGGLALVWASGTSNWIDRLTRHGHVSDCIFLRVGPFHTGIFNVADVVIMIGFTLLAYDLWWRRHKQPTKQSI